MERWSNINLCACVELGNLYIEERESNGDIFEVRKNIFKGVSNFEAKEFCSEKYLKIIGDS